jgi:hypothetical protein
MEIKVIASTKKEYKMSIEEAMNFSGMSAGICYLPKTIDELLNEEKEKTIKRAKNTLKSGHHSVYDHVSYNLVLTNIPKILAIILNNEGIYTTSEKSARYTKMQASDEEKELYEKWIGIYNEEISKKYPNLTEKQALKLAQENARYLISVFTPATVMEYTASIRQLNYIMQFAQNYIVNEPETEFSKQLKPVLKEFCEKLDDIKIEELNADAKSREFSLFSKRDRSEEFGECYSTNYYGTFAEYAQIQRHRTLRYNLKIEENSKFYTPQIIEENEKLVKEWQNDIQSLAKNYPQGMLVKINERGTVEDFILKCKERLCGATQLETMNQTKKTLDKYLEATKNKNEGVYEYLKQYESGVRCMFKDFTCTSPCVWGPKNALTRKI